MFINKLQYTHILLALSIASQQYKIKEMFFQNFDENIKRKSF